jgi:hypothetical protein
MNHHQLKARACLRLARLFLACGIILIAGAILTGPSWVSLVLAVVGVQSINLAAAEYADRRYHLNRSARCKR